MGSDMKQPVMVDTDVLIDAWRGEIGAMTCLELLGHNACPAVSAVTQGRFEMCTTTKNCRDKVFAEIDALPKEYLPFLLQMMRAF